MNNTRIVVVEDEIIVAKDIQQTLMRLGYQASAIAASGATALQQITTLRPDLVLMDIRLRGDMDGITAAERIRQEFDIPVVYLTAHSDSATLQRARSTEPYGYIVKPFTERDLSVAIEIALYRHHVDGKLKRMERWLAATLTSIGDAVIATDLEGIVTFINPVAEMLTGWCKAEAIGRPVAEVFDLVAESDRAPRESPIARVLREGLIIELEPGMLLIAKDGREIAISDSVAPICDAQGAIEGVVLIFRDVTDQRRAAARLREREWTYAVLLRNIAGMAYRCRNDQDWTIELVSDGCLELTGYPSDDLLDNRRLRFSDLIHPDDAGSLREQRQANLAAHRPCSNEYRIRTARGEVKWVWDQAHGIYGPRGALLAIEGVISDITERRKLEAQLQQAQKMESIGRLAGGLAHDFNNLLTAMIGYTDLALEALPPETDARFDLREIHKAADRATALTRQLLAFARKQTIEPRALDLNNLIMDLDNLLRRLLGEDIVLHTLPGPGVGVVRADPNQIEQVIVNMAVNARDAMPEGGVLTIETMRVALDSVYARQHIGVMSGDYVLLAISDTGIGMDETVKEHIFEPFFTTKAPEHGSGLGLATCYGVVKQHGGHIGVYSEPGHGTTFKIYLPCTDNTTAVRPHDGEAADVPRGSETLLLTEDEAAVRALAARVLRDLGYAVLEAANGADALQLAGAHTDTTIRLLITDMVMPYMGGKALLEALRRRHPTIKALFISGYTDNTVSYHTQLDRSEAFLQKPFSPAALARKVRELLDG